MRQSHYSKEPEGTVSDKKLYTREEFETLRMESAEAMAEDQALRRQDKQLHRHKHKRTVLDEA